MRDAEEIFCIIALLLLFVPTIINHILNAVRKKKQIVKCLWPFWYQMLAVAVIGLFIFSGLFFFIEIQDDFTAWVAVASMFILMFAFMASVYHVQTELTALKKKKKKDGASNPPRKKKPRIQMTKDVWFETIAWFIFEFIISMSLAAVIATPIRVIGEAITEYGSDASFIWSLVYATVTITLHSVWWFKHEYEKEKINPVKLYTPFVVSIVWIIIVAFLS